MKWLTIIVLILASVFCHAQAVVHTVANLDTANIFSGTNQFLLGAQLGPVTFANLPTPLPGNTIYCTDCQQTNPCIGGGTGAMADAINSAWSCTAGAGGGGGTINNALQYSYAYYSAAGSANTVSGVPVPTGIDGVPQFPVFSTTAGVANLPLTRPAGIAIRASTCTANADTILKTDRAGYVSWSDASPCAVTLPQANSTGFTFNFVFVGCDIGAGTATITPATSTISYSTGSAYTSGAASLALTTGQCAWVYSDNANYFAIVRSGGGGGGGTVTGSGTTGKLAIWSSSSGIGNSQLTEALGPGGTYTETCTGCTGALQLRAVANSGHGSGQLRLLAGLTVSGGIAGCVAIDPESQTGSAESPFFVCGNNTVSWFTAPQLTFVQLPSVSTTPQGSAVFCSNCAENTNPCTTAGGTGSGTWAFLVNTPGSAKWKCF